VSASREQRPLDGRLVVLGVTGSIAAYKAAELVRLLAAAGADVQVLMTHSAAQFIGPLTLETLSGRRVMLDPLELLPDRRIGHIVAADSADVILVAPATARWLAAMASGLSDDVVTATALASTAPVIVAPAMDGEMYGHPATRANVERLRSFGYTLVEPEVGPLASGQVAKGRLAELPLLVEAVVRAMDGRPIREPDPARRPPRETSAQPQDLAGWRVLVTAGGTAEPIDPVRFIGNHSTGKMGAAVAAAALSRGASVTILRGTTTAHLPEGAEIVDAPTTSDMRRAVLQRLPHSDVLVMAAAVADFRPRQAAGTKLDRGSGLTLELEPTEDILAEASAQARSAAQAAGESADAAARPVLVGFAAETGSLERAAEKAARKGVDLLVANDVSEAGSGFGTDTNRVTIVIPGLEPEAWPLLSKLEVAHRILDRVVAIRTSQGASSRS
jgi:phosphopantothenoylcysteine decarboxylase/phosphopantothenate--cysteine ligase